MGKTEEFGDKTEIQNSNLFPLRVPKAFLGEQFQTLFDYLTRKQNIIALGLYRYPKIVDNTKPYIVTNPPPETTLVDRDIVFVVSPTMPDQTITDTWGSPFEGIPKNAISFNMDKKKSQYDQDFEENNDNVSTNSDINIKIKKKDLT